MLFSLKDDYWFDRWLEFLRTHPKTTSGRLKSVYKDQEFYCPLGALVDTFLTEMYGWNTQYTWAIDELMFTGNVAALS